MRKSRAIGHFAFSAVFWALALLGCVLAKDVIAHNGRHVWLWLIPIAAASVYGGAALREGIKEVRKP